MSCRFSSGPTLGAKPTGKRCGTIFSEACDAPLGATHFFGSIVTKHESAPLGSVDKLLLIDGQQRLTTCILLLAVLRDEAHKLGQEELACEIEEDFLTNRRKEDVDRFKLWPTKDDRATWNAIIHPDAESESALSSMAGKMAEGARYFRRCLQRSNAPVLADLKNALFSRFELVHIQSEAEDDPHRIFESLNAKNERLNETDLLRNYFLMRLPVNEQEKHYHAHWEPMDGALKTDLPEFVRHYLSRKGKLVKKGDVYREVRAAVEKLQPAEVVSYLREMARYAEFYTRFLNPELESCAEVRRALMRLTKLEVTIVYPFLLEVFASRGRGELSDAQVREILEWIENIVLRRWVAGMIRSELNQVLVTCGNSRWFALNQQRSVGSGRETILGHAQISARSGIRSASGNHANLQTGTGAKQSGCCFGTFGRVVCPQRSGANCGADGGTHHATNAQRTVEKAVGRRLGTNLRFVVGHLG